MLARFSGLLVLFLLYSLNQESRPSRALPVICRPRRRHPHSYFAFFYRVADVCEPISKLLIRPAHAIEMGAQAGLIIGHGTGRTVVGRSSGLSTLIGMGGNHFIIDSARPSPIR